MIREEPVPHDFGLLLKPIGLEALHRLELIGVSAERVAHQRKVEPSTGLGLPDVRHLVDEQALPMQRFLRKIFRPELRMRMEMDSAHRRHRDAVRLERPPFAANHPDLRIVDRIAEDGTRELDFAWSEGARGIVYQPLILSSR